MNHDALKSEPMRARSLGYDSSPIIDDAATIAKGIPKPSRKRAMTNMATESRSMRSASHNKSHINGILTILRRHLEYGTDDHNQTADQDRHSATKLVGYPRDERQRQERSQRVERRHQTQDSGVGIVEDYEDEFGSQNLRRVRDSHVFHESTACRPFIIDESKLGHHIRFYIRR